MLTLNLVASSSWSSRLGYAVIQKKLSSINKPNYPNHQIYIYFVANTRSKAPFELNTSFFSPSCLLGSKSRASFVLWGPHKFLQAILNVLLIAVFIICLLIPINLVIWQPRPHWITNKKIINLIRNYGLRISLFQKFSGDGFLQLCLNQSPPWLLKTSQPPLQINKSLDNSVFYYLYTIQPLTSDLQSKLEALNSCAVSLDAPTVNHTLRNLCSTLIKIPYVQCFIDKLNSRIKVKGSIDLILFPTTSFYETRRSSLSSEIELYRCFAERLSSDSQNIGFLLKPHPGSFDRKVEFLVSLSKSLPGIDFSDCLRDYSSFITHIPLEILVHLISDNCDCNLRLIVTSTAGVSLLNLFPSLNFTSAFGQDLLKKFLFPEYIQSRVDQEDLIANALL